MLNHEQTAEETARLALPCQIPVYTDLVGLATADMQLLVGQPGYTRLWSAWQSGRSSAVVIPEPRSIFSSVLQRI